jgi:hypothetical protein
VGWLKIKRSLVLNQHLWDGQGLKDPCLLVLNQYVWDGQGLQGYQKKTGKSVTAGGGNSSRNDSNNKDVSNTRDSRHSREKGTEAKPTKAAVAVPSTSNSRQSNTSRDINNRGTPVTSTKMGCQQRAAMSSTVGVLQ